MAGQYEHPMSALLIDIEAAELREQVPNLRDLLHETPYLATVLEMCCNDVLACAARRLDETTVVLDGTVLGLRVGAWRRIAQEALDIIE